MKITENQIALEANCAASGAPLSQGYKIFVKIQNSFMSNKLFMGPFFYHRFPLFILFQIQREEYAVHWVITNITAAIKSSHSPFYKAVPVAHLCSKAVARITKVFPMKRMVPWGRKSHV